MALTVVDSSVIIAVLDGDDQFHEIAAVELDNASQSGDILIPAVVFAEVLVLPYRLGTAQGQAVETQLHALGEIVPIDEDLARIAAQLRATRNIKLPDALVIATGMYHQANLLTLDKQWTGVYSGVRVFG